MLLTTIQVSKLHKIIKNSIAQNSAIWRTFRTITKGGFLSILLGTLGASLLGNLLTGKNTIRTDECAIRAG